MFDRISIENFRGINSLDIDGFSKINLLVGKNNCGKTSILESVFLCIAPSNPQLPIKTNLFRGYNIIDENSWLSLFSDLNVNNNIFIKAYIPETWEIRNITIKPNYEITLSSESDDKSIKSIELNSLSSSSTEQTINGLTISFSNIYYRNQSQRIKDKVISKIITSGHELKVDVDKQYTSPFNGVFVNTRSIASDTNTRFNNIQVKKKLDDIIDILRMIEPRLENLLLGINGTIYCDIGLDKLIPINVMGDGIFRILNILCAIIDTPNGIVLIDEIDNGFFHTSLDVLWKAVIDAAIKFNVQIFSTTHSLECVTSFNSVIQSNDIYQADLSRLFRIERTNGSMKAFKYDKDNLNSSLESGWEVR